MASAHLPCMQGLKWIEIAARLIMRAGATPLTSSTFLQQYGSLHLGHVSINGQILSRARVATPFPGQRHPATSQKCTSHESDRQSCELPPRLLDTYTSSV